MRFPQKETAFSFIIILFAQNCKKKCHKEGKVGTHAGVLAVFKPRKGRLKIPVTPTGKPKLHVFPLRRAKGNKGLTPKSYELFQEKASTHAGVWAVFEKRQASRKYQSLRLVSRNSMFSLYAEQRKIRKIASQRRKFARKTNPRRVFRKRREFILLPAQRKPEPV